MNIDAVSLLLLAIKNNSRYKEKTMNHGHLRYLWPVTTSKIVNRRGRYKRMVINGRWTQVSEARLMNIEEIIAIFE